MSLTKRTWDALTCTNIETKGLDRRKDCIGVVEFQLKSGSAVVSDPCYARSEQRHCMETVSSIRTGRWLARIHCTDWDASKHGIASLIAYHDSIENTWPEYVLDEIVGTPGKLGIDTGQIGIFDDTVYPQDAKDQAAFSRMLFDARDRHIGVFPVSNGYGVLLRDDDSRATLSTTSQKCADSDKKQVVMMRIDLGHELTKGQLPLDDLMHKLIDRSSSQHPVLQQSSSVPTS